MQQAKKARNSASVTKNTQWLARTIAEIRTGESDLSESGLIGEIKKRVAGKSLSKTFNIHARFAKNGAPPVNRNQKTYNIIKAALYADLEFVATYLGNEIVEDKHIEKKVQQKILERAAAFALEEEQQSLAETFENFRKRAYRHNFKEVVLGELRHVLSQTHGNSVLKTGSIVEAIDELPLGEKSILKIVKEFATSLNFTAHYNIKGMLPAHSRPDFGQRPASYDRLHQYKIAASADAYVTEKEALYDVITAAIHAGMKRLALYLTEEMLKTVIIPELEREKIKNHAVNFAKNHHRKALSETLAEMSVLPDSETIYFGQNSFLNSTARAHPLNVPVKWLKPD